MHISHEHLFDLHSRPLEQMEPLARFSTHLPELVPQPQNWVAPQCESVVHVQLPFRPLQPSIALQEPVVHSWLKRHDSATALVAGA